MIAAGNPTATTRRPRTRDIERIVNGMTIRGTVGPAEDPPEYALTEPIFFEGRCYVAFTGQNAEAVVATERLLEVFGHQAVGADLAAPDTRDTILAVLALSDAIAHRAGVSVGAPADNREDVTVPSTWQSLADAVTWDAADLASALGGKEYALDPLVIEFGSATWAADPSEGPLVRRPIVRLPTGALVVAPGMLATALTRRILTMAVERGILDKVDRGFRESCYLRARDALEFTAAEPSPSPAPVAAGRQELARLYAIDKRSAMLLVTVTSPLAGLDPVAVMPEWVVAPDSPEAEAFWARVDDLANWARSADAGYDEVFVLIVMGAPAGCSVMFAEPREHGPYTVLVVTVAELSVMAFEEQGRPRGLLHFTESREHFRERTDVFGFGVLDQFALYKNHGDSFYLGDTARPTGVFVAPGTAQQMRQRYLDKLRPQSAVWPDGSALPVLARHPEGSPVFVSLQRRSQPIRLVRLSGDVWILGPPRDQLTSSLYELYEVVAEAIAYWAWHVGSAVLGEHTGSVPTTTIFFELDDHDAWLSPSIADVPPAPGDIDDYVNRSGHTGRLVLRPSFRSALHRDDNSGERHLAFVIADLLSRIWLGNELDRPAMARVAEAIGPVGQRKMISLMVPENAIEIGEAAVLPRWQKVSEWHRGILFDDLGEGLKDAGFDPSPVGTREQQNELLKFAVGYFYRRLQLEVGELRPQGVVEDLLLRNEALIRETALERLWLPARIACFGEYSDIAASFRTDLRDLINSSVANRFLLEYVAARPPDGQRAYSDDAYDLLLAIASEIGHLGRLSDVAHFELADVNAHVLDSGRLGLRPEILDRALESYMDHEVPARIRDAQQHFSSHWSRSDGELPPAEVEEAFKAELGLSLTDRGALFGELMNVAVDTQVAEVGRADLVRHLTDTLGWSEDVVSQALEGASLSPRDDFMRPAGFRPEDVYPWRYNRALSFLRRPLIALFPPPGGAVGRQAGARLTWGRRGLYLSHRHLTASVVTGRYTATSQEMRQLLSDFSTEEGLRLQHSVAATTNGMSMVTRERVRRVGPNRLVDDEGDLGDIDVLAADPAAFVVWLIECKNLGVARTPWEVKHELDNLNDPGAGIVARHKRRRVWIEAHLGDLVAWLSLAPGAWRVQPLIVVSSELFGPHLRTPPIAVLDVDDLAGHLVASRKALSPRPARRGSSKGTRRRRGRK